MKHDPELYRASMRELGNRLRIFSKALEPFQTSGTISIANCELAALQLRKMYELIGFASIPANHQRYVELRRRYERDWNLAEILNAIEKFNPAFLPVALDEQYGAGTPDDPHVLQAGEARFEKTQLLEYHGRLGTLLHARNPYARELDYLDWHVWLLERGQQLIEVMELHSVVVEYQRTLYRVAMRDAETHDVRVVIMEFKLRDPT